MDEWLTVEEVAARLKMHPETVRRWLRAEKLDGIWLSDRGGWRISQEAFARFLAQQREASKSAA